MSVNPGASYPRHLHRPDPQRRVVMIEFVDKFFKLQMLAIAFQNAFHNAPW